MIPRWSKKYYHMQQENHKGKQYHETLTILTQEKVCRRLVLSLNNNIMYRVLWVSLYSPLPWLFPSVFCTSIVKFMIIVKSEILHHHIPAYKLLKPRFVKQLDLLFLIIVWLVL